MEESASVSAGPSPWQDTLLWRWLRTGVAAGIDAVLPPRCAACRSVTVGDTGFCPDCWTSLDFLVGPACARCDEPFELPQGEGALCGQCLSDPPPYARVHVPLAYGEISRSIVLRLKYGRRTGFARLMARLIAGTVTRNTAEAGDGDVPLIIPVPLHRWRIWSRGFNQSAEIGRHLSQLTGWPMAVDLVERTRRTPPLRGLGRASRARTVRGAFAMAKGAAENVRDRRILLVDDVFTTGATVAACSRLLLRAGAARVEVAAFARVVERQAVPRDGTGIIDSD